MLTRCPACDTTFRVTPEQLKLRQGKVRCGECQSVFNALETLVEETSVVPATTALDADAKTALATPGDAGTRCRDDDEDIASGIATSLRTGPDADTTAPGERIDPGLPAIDDTPSPTSNRDEPDDALDAAADPGPDDAATQGLVTAGAGREGAATAITPEPVPEPQPPDATPATHSATERDADAIAEDFIDEEPPPPRRWPWVLGSIVALGVLGIQGILHFRTEIAVVAPEARPLLESFCDLTGCSLDLPARVEFTTIESSDLQPVPDKKGLLALSATLRNRAPFAQAYPTLELSLTDHADKAMVRRILLPADYLPAGADPARGFAPGELAITLQIDSGTLGASGYRLYLFYP